MSEARRGLMRKGGYGNAERVPGAGSRRGLIAAAVGVALATTALCLPAVAGFGPPILVPIDGIGPRSVAVGDVNGDGRLDIVTANDGSNNVTVLLGNGSGGFVPASGSPFAVGHSNSVALGDVNRDGNLDIVTANGADYNVTVLLGDGRGGFSPAAGSPFAAGGISFSVALGDVDGDGKLDIVTVTNQNVTVFLGDGRGGFAPAAGSPFPVGQYAPVSAVLGDVNGDGKLDIVTANSPANNVTVLLGDGRGGFSPAAGSPFPVGHDPVRAVLGDVSGDGKLDIVTANRTDDNVTVLIGDGRGGFSPATGSPFAGGGNPVSVALGDVNGDGRLDIVTTNDGSGDVTVLLGNGPGAFTPASGSPFAAGPLSPTWLALGDVDGDRKLDIVTTIFSGDSVAILINKGDLTLSPSTLPGGTMGVAYNQTITASGGTAPYTFSSTGTVPPGLSLSTGGLLSGTPTTAGSYTFTVTTADSGGLAGSQSYTLVIGCTVTITLAPSTLPGGTIGATYSQTITASGGSGTYTFAATGTLPPGLSLSSAGVLSGTPTSSGTYTFTVTATDSNGCPGTQTYSLGIGCSPITISPATLPDGMVATAYSQTLIATGGTGTISFSVTGSLPAGLALSPAGVLSGTPTASGSYSFTVTATDTNRCTATAAYTLSIASLGPITRTSLTSSLNPSHQGQAVTFTATVIGSEALSGNVQLLDGSTVLATQALVSGVATFTTSALAVGTHSITAAYLGATGFDPSTSAPITEVVQTLSGCASGDDTTACLFAGGRFHVQVQWTSPYDPNDTGVKHDGHGVQLTGDTAYFWFFSRPNMELLVKLADGRGVNGRIWFFYGSLSDVEFWITVTDTQTGIWKTYHNPPKNLGSGMDTGTFTDSARPSEAAASQDWLTETLAGGTMRSISELLDRPENKPVAPPEPSPLTTGPCAADDTALCLSFSRFRVQVMWKTYTTGKIGVGHTLPVTGDSGCFWFFSDSNIELGVKIVDGRLVNGKFWVLYGALSDVEYTIMITDTATGALRFYTNPAHNQASFADTNAFLP